MEQTFGDRIKELKVFYGINRLEFSNRCGLSYITVFNLETGKISRPRILTARKIAETFGTSVEWLLFGKGEMLPSGIDTLNPEEEPGIPKGKFLPATYLELKLKNDMLEKELDKLWKLVALVCEKEGSDGDLFKRKAL